MVVTQKSEEQLLMEILGKDKINRISDSAKEQLIFLAESNVKISICGLNDEGEINLLSLKTFGYFPENIEIPYLNSLQIL